MRGNVALDAVTPIGDGTYLVVCGECKGWEIMDSVGNRPPRDYVLPWIANTREEGEGQLSRHDNEHHGI